MGPETKWGERNEKQKKNQTGDNTGAGDPNGENEITRAGEIQTVWGEQKPNEEQKNGIVRLSAEKSSYFSLPIHVSRFLFHMFFLCTCV